jgi:hypothetical protein
MANPNPHVPTRFKPGQSGNPSGRPKTKPITDRMRAFIETEEGSELVADAIVKEWRLMIKAGDSSALRELLRRLEGEVPQKIEAEINDQREDPEFDELIAAYRGHVPGRETGHNGAIEPSGPGGGGQQGQMGDGASPEVAESEVHGFYEGHRNGAVTTNGDHDASEARQE